MSKRVIWFLLYRYAVVRPNARWLQPAGKVSASGVTAAKSVVSLEVTALRDDVLRVRM